VVFCRKIPFLSGFILGEAYPLSRLKRLAREQNDKFFYNKKKSGKRLFSGVSDFRKQYGHLSGILYINPFGISEGFLLRRNEDANFSIPTSIENALLTLRE
jgi:hypothetical protein